MNGGMCVCVLLAALSSSGCLGLPAHPPQEDEGHARAAGAGAISISRAEAPSSSSSSSSAAAAAAGAVHRRHARSAPSSSGGALLPFTKASMEDEEQQDPRTSLNQLIATLLARKGAARRNSVLTSRASGPAASHRIKDRDYTGWMDFGRRSAEEYEYSS
ncbi:cholecystokinin-like [Engraulis encrasicolus]|uniref:cholecystokinin-like n=1 Tax=Engraulis encrasicolus TaxID=184585 RepID=UPI002FD63850